MFCFSLSFAVTMVLFLVGITVAVNNSSHDNQTAGNEDLLLVIMIIYLELRSIYAAYYVSVYPQPVDKQDSENSLENKTFFF